MNGYRPTGPKVKLSNGRTVTNLASYNFYNFVGNEQVKEKAIQTLRTYGVGPCGPPQFYGTQDVHMKTEADIASCLGTEKCIVYAQAFSTISSVIPAFCKRGDIIVADRAVNYAIRKGLQICRSTIRYYEHNNMEDLERVLQKVVKEQAKKPLTRRFIVTEGLFETVGDCVDLPKLVSISHYLQCLGLTIVGRAQTPLQIPPHARRDMVLRRPRKDRSWSHRSPERRCLPSRHDRRFPCRTSLCRRWVLRRLHRCCSTSTYLSGCIYLLRCSPGHACYHRERNTQHAADEPRSPRSMP